MKILTKRKKSWVNTFSRGNAFSDNLSRREEERQKGVGMLSDIKEEKSY